MIENYAGQTNGNTAISAGFRMWVCVCVRLASVMSSAFSRFYLWKIYVGDKISTTTDQTGLDWPLKPEAQSEAGVCSRRIAIRSLNCHHFSGITSWRFAPKAGLLGGHSSIASWPKTSLSMCICVCVLGAYWITRSYNANGKFELQHPPQHLQLKDVRVVPHTDRLTYVYINTT